MTQLFQPQDLFPGSQLKNEFTERLLHYYVGKRIVEFEQAGIPKAEYGKELLKELSKDLGKQYGKGFSRTNLQYMRLLYVKYPKCQTLSGKLSWSYYIELLSISDDTTRSFYEKQCHHENWSVRELKRQRDSALFERIPFPTKKYWWTSRRFLWFLHQMKFKDHLGTDIHRKIDPSGNGDIFAESEDFIFL